MWPIRSADVSSLLIGRNLRPILKVPYSIDLMYYLKTKEPAAGKNFGDLVAEKFLRCHLVKWNYIQLKGTICSENGVSAKIISSQNIYFFLSSMVAIF